MRLAHDDPRAAARLLLALAPVQRALVTTPLEYDLTIHGTGTYAVSVGAERVATRALRGRGLAIRPRFTCQPTP